MIQATILDVPHDVLICQLDGMTKAQFVRLVTLTRDRQVAQRGSSSVSSVDSFTDGGRVDHLPALVYALKSQLHHAYYDAGVHREAERKAQAADIATALS